MGFLLETLDRAKLTNQRDVVRNELRQDEGSRMTWPMRLWGICCFPRRIRTTAT
jgi:hypothetical protein